MSDKARLYHILEALNYVDEFLVGKNSNDLVENAQLRLIIGEASNHLSENLKLNNPQIEWRKIIAFRNFLAHEYFRVDLELIWSITQNNLVELRTTIEKIMREL
jgi:uncharacterized protein with HEPN domain